MDVMGNLINAYFQCPSENKNVEMNLLHGDSRLIILAGTETIAATLVYLFYFLAKHTSQQTKLRIELFKLLKKDPHFFSKIGMSPRLDAVIDETFRL